MKIKHLTYLGSSVLVISWFSFTSWVSMDVTRIETYNFVAFLLLIAVILVVGVCAYNKLFTNDCRLFNTKALGDAYERGFKDGFFARNSVDNFEILKQEIYDKVYRIGYNEGYNKFLL